MSFLKKAGKWVLSLGGLSIARVKPGVRFLFPLDRRHTAKLFYLQRMLGKVEPIEGDIVECGIGKSRTFQMFSLIMSDQKSKRNLWGFDSFEGFPEPSPEDDSARKPQKGEWNLLTPELVYRILSMIHLEKDFIDSYVKLEKGFFEDTLPNSKVSQIALLHLDVDLYDSYKTCLKHLFPKVAEGGVVMFDEYMNGSENERFPGAKKAIDEYFKDTKYKISRDEHCGKYYLIKE